MVFLRVLLSVFFIGKIIVINLTPGDFYIQMENDNNPILLDVRISEDYCESRIVNAIWAGKKTVLEDLLSEISTDRSIFIYCEKGERTKQVAIILQEHNFKKVYDLEGGFKKWVEQGFPIDKEPRAEL